MTAVLIRKEDPDRGAQRKTRKTQGKEGQLQGKETGLREQPLADTLISGSGLQN